MTLAFLIPARPQRRLAAVLLAATIAIAGCGSDNDTVAAPKPVAAASGEGGALARNARLADRIVGDGSVAFAQRMAALRGHPVVVNQWASWCDSCRFEFPLFDAGGKQVDTRIGAYATADQLDADIRRSALGERH